MHEVEEIPLIEYTRWCAYFEIKRKDEAKAARDAEREAKRKARRSKRH